MLTPEVQQIFFTIEKFSSSRRSPIFGESRPERILLALVVMSFVATLSLLFYKPLQFWAIVSGLVFLLSIVSLAVVQGVSTLNTLRTPLRGYASRLESRLKHRIEYIENLAAFSPESLQVAWQALESDATRIQKRLYGLVGAVDKAGIIPAGLALYFAATKIVAGASDFSTNIFTAFIFGLYAGAFVGHRTVELLAVNINCLQEAYDIAKRRSELGRSK
ncbi:hypothetical protein [Methylomonas sp. MgM2]